MSTAYTNTQTNTNTLYLSITLKAKLCFIDFTFPTRHGENKYQGIVKADI